MRLRAPNVEEILGKPSIEELNNKVLPLELDQSRIRENSEKETETEDFLKYSEMKNTPKEDLKNELKELYSKEENTNKQKRLGSDEIEIVAQKGPQSIAEIEYESLISNAQTNPLNISNIIKDQPSNQAALRFSKSKQINNIMNTSLHQVPKRASKSSSLRGFNFSVNLRPLLSPTRNLSNLRNLSLNLRKINTKTGSQKEILEKDELKPFSR